MNLETDVKNLRFNFNGNQKLIEMKKFCQSIYWIFLDNFVAFVCNKCITAINILMRRVTVQNYS